MYLLPRHARKCLTDFRGVGLGPSDYFKATCLASKLLANAHLLRFDRSNDLLKKVHQLLSGEAPAFPTSLYVPAPLNWSCTIGTLCE